MIKDFKAFLIKQNVIGLAIAVVVGAALSGLVKGVVDGLIMPIIAAATPGGDWQTFVWEVGPFKFGIGGVLAALLNFLIVALVAWKMTKLFIKEEAPAPGPATKSCGRCLMTVDARATRCPHCTSDLA